MNKLAYKGYTIEEVDCTTSVTMQCFGHRYTADRNLYEIWRDGEIVKGYGCYPFITSIAGAKEYINEHYTKKIIITETEEVIATIMATRMTLDEAIECTGKMSWNEADEYLEVIINGKSYDYDDLDIVG